MHVAENILTAAEGLIGLFKALCSHVVGAADRNAKIWRWGATLEVRGCLKLVVLLVQFAVHLDTIVVTFARFDCIELEDCGVAQCAIGCDRLAPHARFFIALFGVGYAHFTGAFGLHPNRGFTHVNMAEHRPGDEVSQQVAWAGEGEEDEQCCGAARS